jgi:hypothetical protein
VQAPTKPRVVPPVRSPLASPTASPVVVVLPPVFKPTNSPPPKCPDPSIKDADFCDVFTLPECIVGSTTKTCYRSIKETLTNGGYTCNDDEKCYYNKQCRCNSKFGWMCQTIQSVLTTTPNLIESSKCQNPPKTPTAAPVKKVVPVPVPTVKVPTQPTPPKEIECNNPIPRPNDKCTSATDSTCVANQICCRSLKEILPDGSKVCTPKTCSYTYGCTCDKNQQQWFCWSASILCINDSECTN